jgi:hypothetical protein
MYDQSPPPQPPVPDHLSQQEICAFVTDTLRNMLPKPPIDTPEARDHRTRMAIAIATSLEPATAAEAILAARSVAHGAQADEAMRLAVLHMADTKLNNQMQAQAARMGRESRGYLGTLQRLQAARHKREAAEPDRASTAWAERDVQAHMTEALESLPPEPDPLPPPEAQAATAAAPSRLPAWQPRDYSEWSDEEKRVDRIRQLGGLPPDCDYEPPRPEVLHAIITGTGSNMRWADTYEGVGL